MPVRPQTIHAEERRLGREIAPHYAAVYHTSYYRALRRALVTRVVRICRGRSCRVLDLGCGPLSLTVALRRALPAATVTGVDVSWDMLAAGRRAHPDVRVCQGLAEALPFRSETFDVIVGFGVLHHLPALAPAFGELARVLREDGHCVFGEPQRTPFDERPWLIKAVKLLLAPLYAPLWLKYRNWPRPPLEERLERLVTDAHRMLTVDELHGAAIGAPLRWQWRGLALLSAVFAPVLVRDGRVERVVLACTWALDQLLARGLRPLAGELLVTGRRRV